MISATSSTDPPQSLRRRKNRALGLLSQLKRIHSCPQPIGAYT